MRKLMVLDPIGFAVAKARAGIKSNAELSRRLKVSPGYLRIIGGGMLPPQRVRRKIAKLLGAQESEIWRLVELPDSVACA